MLLLSREDIKKVFTIKDAIEADKKAFQLVVEGKCEAPLRTNIQAPKYEGCFLFMPAYVEEMDTASLKIINIFPHNIDQGIPSSPAQVLLIDGTTGQAPTQLEAMMAARKLEEVRVYDLNLERTKEFAARMQEELKDYGTRIVAVESSDAAIDDADLIITVTPSSKPVFDGTKVKAGATISCVGAYQHHMQEMDPAILPRASKIYFDSEDAVLSESGDILIPLEQGIITKDDFTGDLGQVIKGEVVGRENDEEIIVFETVGVATQDLVAAREIYDKAVAAGVGINWN